MGKVLGGLVGLAIAGGILCALERLAPALPGQRREPGSVRTDALYWVLAPLKNAVAEAAFVAALAIFALRHGWRGMPFEEWFADRTALFARMPHAVQVVVTILAFDFFAYWWHRLEHRGPLWRLHAIHHSSTRLDWLAAARNHPLAEALSKAAFVTPMLALGIDPRVAAGVVPLLGLYALLLHANVPWGFGPLRYVLATPLFHRWHHAAAPEARDTNFAALLPVWDLIFGTFRCPDRQPETFGADAAVPPGFLAQLAWPFRRATMRLT